MHLDGVVISLFCEFVTYGQHMCSYDYALHFILLSYRIISVHLTASCSSISLSLYWFLSIRTLAISTRVKRFLCAVGTSLCRHNTSMRSLN